MKWTEALEQYLAALAKKNGRHGADGPNVTNRDASGLLLFARQMENLRHTRNVMSAIPFDWYKWALPALGWFGRGDAFQMGDPWQSGLYGLAYPEFGHGLGLLWAVHHLAEILDEAGVPFKLLRDPRGTAATYRELALDAYHRMQREDPRSADPPKPKREKQPPSAAKSRTVTMPTRSGPVSVPITPAPPIVVETPAGPVTSPAVVVHAPDGPVVVPEVPPRSDDNGSRPKLIVMPTGPAIVIPNGDDTRWDPEHPFRNMPRGDDAPSPQHADAYPNGPPSGAADPDGETWATKWAREQAQKYKEASDQAAEHERAAAARARDAESAAKAAAAAAAAAQEAARSRSSSSPQGDAHDGEGEGDELDDGAPVEAPKPKPKPKPKQETSGAAVVGALVVLYLIADK